MSGITLDMDGYPTDSALTAIDKWSADDFTGLMEYIRPYFERHGSFRQRGEVYRLATGGWSGCEDIIDALQSHPMFYALCWEMSRRGGLHIFHVRDYR